MSIVLRTTDSRLFARYTVMQAIWTSRSANNCSCPSFRFRCRFRGSNLSEGTMPNHPRDRLRPTGGFARRPIGRDGSDEKRRAGRAQGDACCDRLQKITYFPAGGHISGPHGEPIRREESQTLISRPSPSTYSQRVLRNSTLQLRTIIFSCIASLRK